MEWLKRRSQQSHIGNGNNNQRSRHVQTLAWALIVASMLFLVCAVSAPTWLPRAIRSVIPGGYIETYFPEPLRAFALSRPQVLPTLAPQTPASDLLGEIDFTASGTPTALPTIAVDQTELGTPTLAATPTLTPAFINAQGTPVVIDTSALPTSHYLTGARIIPQGWNMCGPATLASYLSYWGVPADDRMRDEISSQTKPEYEDKNSSPEELARYAESLGFRTLHRVGGDIDLLRTFIARGYPVMIERGFIDEIPGESWMGHYMLMIGYDDADRQFAALDSYWTLKSVNYNPDNPMDFWDYDILNEKWRHFAWTYLVIFPPAQADEVAAIVGEDMDDTTMYYNTAQRLSAELTQNRDDMFGWFSLGTALVGLKDYERAAQAYDQARTFGLPFRMLWYQFGPYEAYHQTGQNQTVRDLANWTLGDYPISEEAFYYRGISYSAQGDTISAERDLRRALEINPQYPEAQLELGNLAP